MSVSISSLNAIAPAAGIAKPLAAVTGGQSAPFSSLLEGAIQAVEAPQKQADQAIQSFLNGENEELHTVALATQRASLAFDLGMQVRNKIIAAYQEVMRMQL